MRLIKKLAQAPDPPPENAPAKVSKLPNKINIPRKISTAPNDLRFSELILQNTGRLDPCEDAVTFLFFVLIIDLMLNFSVIDESRGECLLVVDLEGMIDAVSICSSNSTIALSF